MKKSSSILFAFIMLALVSCSSSDNDNSDKNSVSGTIQLSGPDTSTIGTSLEVGNIDVDGLGTTGTSKSVTLLDKNTTIKNGEVESNDFSNGFIIVASEFTLDDSTSAQKVISMTIVKDGNEFKYGCLTPLNNSPFVECGAGLKVDKQKKEVVFDNTTVKNTKSDAILTMNGVVTWN